MGALSHSGGGEEIGPRETKEVPASKAEMKANPKSPDYLGLAPFLPLLSGSIGRIIDRSNPLVCTSADTKSAETVM